MLTQSLEKKMILHVHCSLGLYVNQIGFSFSVYFGPEITIFFFKDRNRRGEDFDFFRFDFVLTKPWQAFTGCCRFD